MKNIVLLLLCLLFIIPCSLFAQDNFLASMFAPNTAGGDTLTSRYVGFVHANWSQAGIGLSYRQAIVMYNKTVLPGKNNYKSDMTTNDVNFQIEGLTYEVNKEYDNIMAGYMLRISPNLYPYIALGTAILIDYVEINDPTASPSVYTVKGKDVTYGTGIGGFIYQYRKNIILEAGFQYKPMLPFVGIGIVF